MKSISIGVVVFLFLILRIICNAETTTKQTISAKNLGIGRCQKPKNGQQKCFCGKNKVSYDRLKGEKCVNGQIVQKGNDKSPISKLTGLRLTTKSIHQSTRDDNKNVQCVLLRFKPPSGEDAYVPLLNVSVEAWIDSFAADVTLTQVFVNREENPIEAVYVFPIEENAAVYSFTAQIDDRTITAVLKEKKTAEKEYESAVEQGQTAVLMRQSKETLDTFTVNVGALPPGKQCQVTIKYVTELDLVDGSSIRFVVPTTIAPRYNPKLGHLQLPDQTETEYVQKTPYSMWFQAHVLRGEEYKIMQVANLSHPLNVSVSNQSIDVFSEAIALDRDIILDIDLPANRPTTAVTIEQFNDSSQHAILLAFTPNLSDFIKISNGTEETNTEFIFIVDCSGSMTEANGIGLAKEAMLLFIRSLPVGSNFNIIRFGSNFDILFKNEVLTTVYDEKTAKEAETLTRSMEANFGGTELLEPLKHLKKHPPIKGRSRQIFLLTDGEISNTNEVIELCRSMSSTTRIFSFGLGHSPSRSLVKGLARATNGYFVFVPPNSKVDTYVGSQFGRALQPSLVNARLEWHGLSTKGTQAPKTIPPLYINDRILVYKILEDGELKTKNVSVDLIAEGHKISSIKLSNNIPHKRDIIRRLATKALIQELLHEKSTTEEKENNSTLEERITALSMNHQILSPYTAFVGVETTGPKINNTHSKTRHIPIQISKGDEHLVSNLPTLYSNYHSGFGSGSMPVAMASLPRYGSPMAMPMYGMARPPIQRASLPLYRPSGSMAYGSGQMPPMTNQFQSSGLGFIAYGQKGGYSPDSSDTDDDSQVVSTTTLSTLLSTDPVRWFIDQQSFNGAWLLNDKDIEKLTSGKSLSTFQSTVTKTKDALTTALAIAILESKYADQKNLWNAVVRKGRKQLHSFGLSDDQVNTLINEIKSKL